jgi:hypothetical protein
VLINFNRIYLIDSSLISLEFANSIIITYIELNQMEQWKPRLPFMDSHPIFWELFHPEALWAEQKAVFSVPSSR